jgi:Chitobiase/beta-hexosaminidase C-terminal domain
MDRTPPTTIDNIPSGWNQRDSYTVILSAIDYADTQLDTPSGVRATYYTLDGSEPNFNTPLPDGHINSTSDYEFFTEIPVTVQGNHTIKFFSIDNLGNAEFTKTKILKLDNQPPTTSFTASFIPDGSDGWYKTNPTISLSAIDTVSGINKIFFRWGSNTFQEYSIPFQIPNQGIHSLQFYSVDNAGNVENIKTSTFLYDFDLPITEDDVPSGVQKQPVTIHFFTTDNVSGVKNTYYTTNGSNPTVDSDSGSSVTISETGSYIIKYFSVDFAGNEEEIKQSAIELNIDTEAPHVYISESFPINGSGGWYRTSPLISLIATDESEVDEIKFKRFPSGATTTAKYTSTVDLTNSANLRDFYKIKIELDQSGTQIEIDIRGSNPQLTTVAEIVSKINSTIGSTVAFETDSSGNIGYGYVTVKSVKAETEDPTAEVKFVQPSEKDATALVFGLDELSYPHTFTELVVFETYITPFTLLYDGYWQVDFYATDSEGNVGSVQSKQYKLDSQNPVTVISVSYPPDGNNNWYITNPEISLSVSDNKSGVYKTFYQWDNGVTFEYIGIPFQIPSSGLHVLRYYSIDLAGNIESSKTQNFTFDDITPVTKDNTLNLQGIIFTAVCDNDELKNDDDGEFIGTISLGPNFLASKVKTNYKNVKSVLDFYNVTKNQNYHVYDIVGSDEDELLCLPIKKNENSSIISSYEIQLLEVVTGNILRDYVDVFKVYNRTNNTLYTIDPSGSSKVSGGVLKLSGEKPLTVGDLLEVDYAYNGPVISPSDSFQIDYRYDSSHEPETLNTLDYTFITPLNSPKVHDHSVTIKLKAEDSESGVIKTFYTLFSTDPKDGAFYTSPNLSGTVNLSSYYKIKLEIDNSSFPIEIDLRGADPSNTSLTEITNKINTAVGQNIATHDSVYITLKSLLDPTNISAEIKFLEPSDHDATFIVFGLNTQYPHTFKVYSGNEFELVENGTYTIRYYSVDVAGNIEDTKTAQYQIIIDRNIPEISITKIPDIAEDGNYPWFKKNYGLKINVSSDDIQTEFSQPVLLVSSYNIITGKNDKIDFKEAYATELTLTIDQGIYTENDLATELQSKFNSIGASGYAVSVTNHKFTITSMLFAGDNIFELLWNTGTYKEQSAGKTLGFDITTDDVSNSSYTSDYFKVKTPDSFLFIDPNYPDLPMVENYTTLEKLTVIDIDAGASGLYDEIILDGSIPSISDSILADYRHYVGIEKVCFGINSIIFTETVTVSTIPKLEFIGFDNDRVNYEVIYPGTAGQFYLLEGQHLLYSQVFDANSIPITGIPQKSSNILQTALYLDTNVPVTTDDIISTTWQKGPVTITLTPTDVVPGSGISATHFTLDGSNPTTLSPKIQNFPNQKIVINVSGIYIVKYFSVDVAGNQESIKTASLPVKVDSSVPQTILETTPAIPDGLNGWFINAPTINFNATDLQSGIKETWYKLPGDLTFTLFVAPFILSNQADNEIQFFSIDNVGNVEVIKSAHVKYDNVVPITTTNIPLVGYTSNKTVVFSINDVVSGGMITYFTIDGSTPTLSSTSGSSIVFNSSGTYTIKYFSLDYAGNQESVKTSILNLDLEVPVITNFLPVDCIVTEDTDVISFYIEDSLSGVDISGVVFEVDGIEYSQSKNSSYFNVYGTPASYFIQIYPIKGVLNFEDIEVLTIRNVKDLAGNTANIVEYDFRLADITPPRVKEVNPIPNALDVSTNSNIICYIYDNQSGVDIQSIKVFVNSIQFSIVTNDILNVQYIGSAETVSITINNNYLRISVDGIQDISVSLIDSRYDTVKKLNDYFNSLSTYSSEILNSKYEQNRSKDLLSITDVDMKSETILKLFIPIDNLSFSFLERENGYLVFVSPNFIFQHNSKVSVSILAKDNVGNEMLPFNYSFTPSIVATLSVNKRNYLNKTALTFIEDIQNNIASNYTRSRSTHFYGHHKSIGKELSRVQEDLDHLFLEDMQFATVRSQYLYEKFGYLLKTPQSADLSETDYRRLLLSLLGILFKGSLKSSIEKGVSLFLGSQILIKEVVFSEGSDISDQFVFTTDIILSDTNSSSVDIQALNEQLDHLFSLVKPAHVYNLKRFVFSDMFAFQSGCELQWLKDNLGNYVLDVWGNKIPILGINGFQTAIKNSPTAICDRYIHSLDSTFNEDMRTDCAKAQEEIETVIDDVSLQATGSNDTFTTTHKPLLKNVNPPVVAQITDVIVTVNGIPAIVLEIDAVNGIVKIDQNPLSGDEVIITYFYNENYVYRQISFYLNDYVVSGNDFDQNQGSIFNQQNVNDVMGGFDIDYSFHAHVCESLNGSIDWIEEDIVNGNSFIVTDQNSLIVPYSDSNIGNDDSYILNPEDKDYKLLGMKQRYFDEYEIPTIWVMFSEQITLCVDTEVSIFTNFVQEDEINITDLDVVVYRFADVMNSNSFILNSSILTPVYDQDQLKLLAMKPDYFDEYFVS